MTSTEETAKRVLEEVMAPSLLKFSDFRSKMIVAHPEYVSDDEIHALYVRLVMGQPATEIDEEATAGERLLLEIFGNESVRKNAALLDDIEANSERYASALEGIPHFKIPLGEPEPDGIYGDSAAVDQIVAQADASRATPEEVRKVAERKPVRYSKKSKRKKKSLGERTLQDVFIDTPRRAAKRFKFPRT